MASISIISPPVAGETVGCVFVGALDYKPNVEGAAWFCRKVWPELRRRHPQARCQLVGRRRPAASRRSPRSHSGG